MVVACGGPRPPEGGEPPSGECAQTIGADITIPTRLANLGSGCDYLVAEYLNVTSELVIEAGTEVQFAQDSGWQFSQGGSLQAVGTEDQRIALRGVVNTTGYWYGLCFSDNRASRLEWVDLLNAGKVWLEGSTVCRAAIGGIAGGGEPLDVVDTLVAGSHTTGLDAVELNLGTFARNVFAANQEFGVRVSAGNLRQLDSASDYTGESVGAPNAKAYVYLSGTLADPGATHQWPRLDAPYFVGEDVFGYHHNVIVNDATNVEVGAGTRFVFGPRGGINVWDFASFTAVGTEEEPVVFTGQVQKPGSWEGLSTIDGALHLEHTEVSWGGASGIYAGNVSIAGVDLAQDSYVLDSLIKGSETCGIFATEDAAPLVWVSEHNVYEDNAQDLCVR